MIIKTPNGQEHFWFITSKFIPTLQSFFRVNGATLSRLSEREYRSTKDFNFYDWEPKWRAYRNAKLNKNKKIRF